MLHIALIALLGFSQLHAYSFAQTQLNALDREAQSSAQSSISDLNASLIKTVVQDGETKEIAFNTESNETILNIQLKTWLEEKVLSGGEVKVEDKSLILSLNNGDEIAIDIAYIIDKANELAVEDLYLDNGELIAILNNETNKSIVLPDVYFDAIAWNEDTNTITLALNSGEEKTVSILPTLKEDLGKRAVGLVADEETKSIKLILGNGEEKIGLIDGWFDNFWATNGTLDLSEKKITIGINDESSTSFDIDMTPLTDELDVLATSFNVVELSDDNKTLSFMAHDGTTKTINVTPLEVNTYMDKGDLDLSKSALTFTRTDGTSVIVAIDELVERLSEMDLVSSNIEASLSDVNDTLTNGLDLLTNVVAATNRKVASNTDSIEDIVNDINETQTDLLAEIGTAQKTSTYTDGIVTVTSINGDVQEYNITSLIDDAQKNITIEGDILVFKTFNGERTTFNMKGFPLTREAKALIDDVNATLSGEIATINTNIDALDETIHTANKTAILNGDKIERTSISGLTTELDLSTLSKPLTNEASILELNNSLQLANNNVTFLEKKLTVTRVNGTTYDVDLSTLQNDNSIESIALDDANKKLIVTTAGGTTTDVDLTTLYDNVNVTSGIIDADGKKMVLTLSDSSTIDVDLGSVYALIGANVNSVTFDVDTKKIVTTKQNGESTDIDVSPMFDNVNVTNIRLDNANQKLITNLNDVGSTELETDLSLLYSEMDSKETAFEKNSAFNKSFGVTSGSVAKGDHSHTQLHDHANKPTLDMLDYAASGNDNADLEVQYNGKRIDTDGSVLGGTYTFTNYDTAITFIESLSGKTISKNAITVVLPEGTLTTTNVVDILAVGNQKFKLIILGQGKDKTVLKNSGDSIMFNIIDSNVQFRDLTLDCADDSIAKIAVKSDRSYIVFTTGTVSVVNSEHDSALYINDSTWVARQTLFSNIKGIRLSESTVTLNSSVIEANSEVESRQMFYCTSNSILYADSIYIEGNGKLGNAYSLDWSSKAFISKSINLNLKNYGAVLQRGSYLYSVGSTFTNEDTGIATFSLATGSTVEINSNKIDNVKYGILLREESFAKVTNTIVTGITYEWMKVTDSTVIENGSDVTGADDRPQRIYESYSGKIYSTACTYEHFKYLGITYYTESILTLKDTEIDDVIHWRKRNYLTVKYGANLRTFNNSDIGCNVASNSVTFDGRRIE